MYQDNTQLNTGADETSVEKRKRSKFWNILLWLIIIALAAAVVVRAFVISKVTVSGLSMTSSYYNNEDDEYYNPDLTFHDGDTVVVNKMKKPQRGDVVVFYKYPVKSKFLALFARGDSTERDGEYYKLIKRVVALGGDKIWVEQTGDNEYMLVIQTPDGEILYEDQYKKNGKTLSCDSFKLIDQELSGLGNLRGTTQDNPIIIEEGYFFAIGDNRVNSDDSRGPLGQVPLAQMFGVVIDRQNSRLFIKGSQFI